MKKWFEQCGSVVVFSVIPCQGATAKGDFLCDKSWKNGKSIHVNHVQTGGLPMVSGRYMVT